MSVCGYRGTNMLDYSTIFKQHLVWEKPVGSYISFVRTDVPRTPYLKQHKQPSQKNRFLNFTFDITKSEVFKLSIMTIIKKKYTIQCYITLYNSSEQIVCTEYANIYSTLNIIQSWMHQYPNTNIYVKYNEMK